MASTDFKYFCTLHFLAAGWPQRRERVSDKNGWLEGLCFRLSRPREGWKDGRREGELDGWMESGGLSCGVSSASFHLSGVEGMSVLFGRG